MNILTLVANAGRGGHTSTAVDLSNALSDLGHSVVIATQEGSPHFSVGKDIVHIRATFGYSLQGLSLSNPLMKQLASFEWSPDVVHTYSWAGVPTALSIARASSIPAVWTLCGGSIIPFVAPVSRYVFLSGELSADLVRSHQVPPNLTAVIPGRLPPLDRDPEDARRYLNDVRRRAGWNRRDIVVLRVARVSASYAKSVAAGASLTGDLRDRGLPARFLHVGYETAASLDPTAPAARRFIDQEIARVNARHGETVAVSDPGGAPFGRTLPHEAQVVVGAGKAVMEGLLYSKPTVVVGKRGLWGLVGPSTLDYLAFHNFAGRGSAPASTYSDALDGLVRLLTNDATMSAYEKWCESIVPTFLATTGAERLTELYQELTPTEVSRAAVLRAYAQAVRLNGMRRAFGAKEELMLRIARIGCQKAS